MHFKLECRFILQKGGFGFRSLIAYEQYLDKHRDDYYHVLIPATDATKLVEFFLTALVTQAKLVLKKLHLKQKLVPEDELLPRRREILEIIQDHPYCSFDFIRRRFLAINPKTLHYDLKQLQNQGFIRKLGVTRGSVYKEL